MPQAHERRWGEYAATFSAPRRGGFTQMQIRTVPIASYYDGVDPEDENAMALRAGEIYAEDRGWTMINVYRLDTPITR